ncbi:MAG: hypothetical protein K6E86_05595 [Bacteroidales bacterium]|nr:hypothetical protein [Bacteroidales bacterium]
MNKLLYLGVAALLVAGCGNLEDDDYFTSSTVSNNNADIQSTDQTVAAYIQGRSDLSQMSALFEQQGIYEQMPTSGELHTVLVVVDDNYSAPEADEAEKVAKSHVTNISVSPSRLNDEDRLLMWHNKYVTVSLDEEAEAGNVIGHMLFNSSTLEQVIKAKDGFIYVISDMIVTPTSLQDYINGLDDEKYSRFKSMVTTSGGQEFDKANSKAVGIDANGNTIYDSVFIYTNEFFDAKNFDLSSEALKATMFVFRDEVIEKALTEAKAKLHDWGYDHKMQLLRNGSYDSLYVGYTSDEDLEKWILEAAFYSKTYTAADLRSEDNQSIKSIYDRVWRNDVQTLDLDNPVSLSNGVAYEVKEFRIPNNRLIYRLHEEFNVYEKCDADQKALYFKSENLGTFAVKSNEVAPWTPLSGVWPAHGNSPLTCKVADNTVEHYQMDYTPVYSRPNADGGYDVHVLMVPPGTYRMAMGFKQNNPAMSVQLIAVDEAGDQYDCAEAVSLALSDGSTTYHYDRGATLSNRLPEYYDVNDTRFDETLKSKYGYYWTDGGPVYTEVEVPDVNGDGKAVQLLIRMIGENGKSAGTLTFNHWCLRPTENNY